MTVSAGICRFGGHAILTSSLRLVFSRKLEALLAEADAKIAEIEAKLIRERISRLPQELVIAIFKLILTDAVLNSDTDRISVSADSDILACVKLTQVEEHSSRLSVWSFIYTTNADRFTAYMERSADHPLNISIRDNRTPEKGRAILQLVVANMYRIRSLCLPSSDCDHIMFHGIHAPLLEILRFPWACRPLGCTEPGNLPIVMPKLRQLHLNGQSHYEGGWRCLLPPRLPEITDLTMRAFYHDDAMDILQRYPAVLRLRVSSSPSRTPTDVRTVTLPHLLRLWLDDIFWSPFFCLALPSIQRVDINIRYHSINARNFHYLERVIRSEPLKNLIRGRLQSHHISVVCRFGHAIAVQLRDSISNTLVSLNLEYHAREANTNWIEPNLPEVLKNCLQFARSSGFGIHSIDIEDTHTWHERNPRFVLWSLRDCSDINTISLRGVSGLAHFLAHPGFNNHKNPWDVYEAYTCSCSECREIHFTSYCGLKMFVFEDRNEGQLPKHDPPPEEIWRMLVEWLDDRVARGLRLKTMVFVGDPVRYLDPRVLGGISRAVVNVVVRSNPGWG